MLKLETVGDQYFYIDPRAVESVNPMADKTGHILIGSCIVGLRSGKAHIVVLPIPDLVKQIEQAHSIISLN